MNEWWIKKGEGNSWDFQKCSYTCFKYIYINKKYGKLWEKIVIFQNF